MILAGNWKMNMNRLACESFFAELSNKLSLPPQSSASQSLPSIEMRIYVPYLLLETAQKYADQLKTKTGVSLSIGAQNVHFELAGAYTGEISGPMLKEINVHHVLIGHSERRTYFNETNEMVLKKTESAIEQGLQALICIGETLEERNGSKTDWVLAQQLEALLRSEKLKPHWGKSLHLAYEPVWAIGTGVTATPEQAEETHAYIRKVLTVALGGTIAAKVNLLYGGSVASNNFENILAGINIDGGLVGGASLKVDSWAALWNTIHTVEKKRKSS